MDQIALRVTLTLLKNLRRKQICLPSNMVDRTKEQLIMNIDPYVRVTEVKISFVDTNFIHKKFVRKYSRKMINFRISHRWTGSIIGASDTCVLTLTCQIFAQQILLFLGGKNTYRVSHPKVDNFGPNFENWKITYGKKEALFWNAWI